MMPTARPTMYIMTKKTKRLMSMPQKLYTPRRADPEVHRDANEAVEKASAPCVNGRAATISAAELGG